MSHGSHSSIWALTPAGAMGMSDDQVASGQFDQPGMTGMQEMSMAQGHTMGQGEHTASGDLNMSGEKMSALGGHHMPAATMPDTHEMMTAGETRHGTDVMLETQHNDRKGKKYAKNFRPFAADVSSRKNLAPDGMDAKRPWPPYANLRAIEPTLLDAGKTVRDIRLTLDGDMERYVWFLNNTALSESDVIQIRAGEVVRFIMINRTMMHHPMHLHGHFFRVINGQGDHAPLKHTVDVAPMSTTVIEFAANEFGDWFFHCHLLYHMKSGMARVIHYDGYQPDTDVAASRPLLFKESWYAWGDAEVLSNMTEGFVTLADTRNIFEAQWEAGWQDVDETEWEGLLTYDRYLNRFSSIFAGLDVMGQGDATENSRGVFGFRYLLPLNFESFVWVDSDGGARVDVEKAFTLTPRLSLIGEIEYDTHDLWEGKTGLSYVLSKNVSLLGQWHSEFGWGGGLQVRF